MNQLPLRSRRHAIPFFGLALVCASTLSACGGGGSGSAVPTATPIGTPGVTPTTPIPTGPGLLVFATAPEGADVAQTDIYSVNPNGTNYKRLTTSAPDAQGNVQPQGSPALSPNRQQIVYVSVSFVNGGNQSQLRIMNADGGNNRVLSNDPNLSGATVPTWSPDGQRIAFSKGNDGIFIVNANGTGVRQLTNRGANPSWSFQNQIAFNAPPGVQAVSGLTASTRKPRAVLPPGTSVYNDIWTIGADGSGLRQLTRQNQTEAGLANINPAWSPDGQTLVFNTVPGSGVSSQLFLMNADGGNRRSLGGLNGTDAVWSPNGARIAYSSEAGLFTANADGTNPTPLDAADGIFGEDIDWR